VAKPEHVKGKCTGPSSVCSARHGKDGVAREGFYRVSKAALYSKDGMTSHRMP